MKTNRDQRLINQVVKIAGGNQRAAAEKLGVTQASISRYQNGKSVPITSVILLARMIVTKAGRRPTG